MKNILDRFYQYALGHLTSSAGVDVQVVVQAFVEQEGVHVKDAERLVALLSEQGVRGVSAPRRANREEPAVESQATEPPQMSDEDKAEQERLRQKAMQTNADGTQEDGKVGLPAGGK